MDVMKRIPLNAEDMHTEVNKRFAEDILRDVGEKALNYGVKPYEYEYFSRAVCTIADSNIKRIYDLVDELRAFDATTWEHSIATALHTSKMLRAMKQDKFKINDRDCVQIAAAAFLHDIGKMSIDKDILNKPSRLTDQEFSEVKKHTLYGLSTLYAYDPHGSFMNRYISVVVSMHHHKCGLGYSGLSEHIKQIRAHEARQAEDYVMKKFVILPLEARHYLAADVVGICDSYSAQVELRPYTKVRKPQEAFNDIVRDLERGGILNHSKELLKSFSEAYDLSLPDVLKEAAAVTIER